MMVFRGIRSAACAECRIRKTKCDLSRPACGQCIRTKRECSGPRDSSDRIFVHGIRAPRTKKSKKQSPVQSEIDAPVEARCRQTDVSPLPGKSIMSNGLTTYSLENLGISWFMHTRHKHYTQFAMQHSSFSSYHDRLDDTGINQAMVTLGLAGYAKEMRQHEFMDLAEIHYIKALRSVNRQLSIPEIATKDGVLFSIMMLIMFEGNTWRRELGMKNFVTHFEGLMSLISLSLRQGNLSALHRKTIAFILRMVLFLCWYTHKPLPSAFSAADEVAKYDLTDIELDLRRVVVGIVQFQSSVKWETTSYTDIIQDGKQINSTVQDFLRQTPSSRRWREYTVEDHPELLYEACNHFYPPTHVAIAHNLLRVSQIHCNLIIIDACRLALDSPAHEDKTEISSQIATCKTTVKSIAKDICAFIAQLANHLDRCELQNCLLGDPCHMEAPHQTTTTLIELSPFRVYHPKPFRTHKPNPRIDGSRAPKLETIYHAFWVLLCLSEISFLDEYMELWIKGQISWIEKNTESGDLETLRGMRHELQKRVNMGLYKIPSNE